MSDAVEVFTFQQHNVRVVDVAGSTWFVATDVCAVLDISNPSQAVSYLDEDERDTTLISSEGGQERIVNIISEAGLYSMILRSRKPEAKAFKRWVTHEVLPALRKNGSYTTRPASQLEILAQAVAELQRVELVAIEAKQSNQRTEARLDAIEGRHDWFAALGYARLKGWCTERVYLQRLGLEAGRIGRAAGLPPSKVQHGLYGQVNQWPAWCWDQAYEQMREAS